MSNDYFEDFQLEVIKILSIAINMAKSNDQELIPYLEEQRQIIQKDIAIANDEEGKIIELDLLPNRI